MPSNILLRRDSVEVSLVQYLSIYTIFNRRRRKGLVHTAHAYYVHLSSIQLHFMQNS